MYWFDGSAAQWWILIEIGCLCMPPVPRVLVRKAKVVKQLCIKQTISSVRDVSVTRDIHVTTDWIIIGRCPYIVSCTDVFTITMTFDVYLVLYNLNNIHMNMLKPSNKDHTSKDRPKTCKHKL